MRTLFLASALLFVSLPAFAQELPPQHARVIPLLEILGEPLKARESFLRDNMTSKAIEGDGLERWTAITGEISAILGVFRLERVTELDGRVALLLQNLDRAEWFVLELTIGPAPGHKIDNIRMGPTAPPEGAVPRAAPETLTSVLSEYMAARQADGFAGAVLVARGDELVYSGAFGPADADAGAGNTLLTAFPLGELTKMFTAVLIAQLVEEGQLDWTDPVGMHMPDSPNEQVRVEVAIGHLLTHRSGLGAFPAGADGFAALRSQSPGFRPGTRFEYSDAGYVLLGLIAERLTGKDYRTLVADRIFEPAGMRQAGFYEPGEMADCCALGHAPDGSVIKPTAVGSAVAARGAFASAADLWRFARAFRAGELVKRDTRDLMVTPHSQMTTTAGYGIGFAVFEDADLTRYGHVGTTPGTRADLMVYSVTGYTIVVLSNQANGDIGLAPMLRRIVLGAVID